MALTKSIITGRVPLPTDDTPKMAELTFTLSALDSEGADVLPPGVNARVVLVSGLIPSGFSLWRNTEGWAGTHYIVTARWVEQGHRQSVLREAVLGRIQVRDQASYTLAELLAEGSPPASNTIWTTITQAQYDAFMAAAAEAVPAAAAAEAARDQAIAALGPVISAASFGVLPGDGVTDVTAVFEAAVTAYPGSMIYVPAGTHVVTKPYRYVEMFGPGVMIMDGVEVEKKFYRPGESIQAEWFPAYEASAAITAVLAYDNTPPRNDEGVPIVVGEMQRRLPSSLIEFDFDGDCTSATAGETVMAWAIAQSDVGARVSRVRTIPAVNAMVGMRLRGFVTPQEGARLARVTIRAGSVGGSLIFNGVSAGPRLDGTMFPRLRMEEVAGEFVEWGGRQTTQYIYGAPVDGIITSDLPMAPGLVDYLVSKPNGDTPTEAAIDSHRYRHHATCAVHNGRVWVAHSSSGTSEDAGGQMTVITSSLTGSISFAALQTVVPAQSAWSGTGAPYPNGSRVTFPRTFARVGGDLYIVAAIDTCNGSRVSLGMALVARRCNADGSLGPLFRVSPQEYTPLSGFAAIPYDATLGAQIMPQAILHGSYGGSHADEAIQMPWRGFARRGNTGYSEPATVNLSGDGRILCRLWRRLHDPNRYMGQEYSLNGGATWSGIRDTNMPNNPSAMSLLRLPSGKIALASNLQRRRDPLCLSLYDPEIGTREETVYAVAQNIVPTAPVYPGTAKGSFSAAYPSLAHDGTYLWCAYSHNKEDIRIGRIDLSSL